MRYLKILYVQVIIGIVLGVIVGWQFPAFAPAGELLSKLFINAVKMVIAPVIFFTIVAGITGAGDMKKAGRVGGKALLYFEVVTTLALIIGLITANLVKPGAHVRSNIARTATPTGEGLNWMDFVLHIIPSNIVDAFAKGDIIQILFFGILFGIGLKQLGSYGNGIIAGFDKLNKVLFNVLKMVMKASPLGAFGGMAFAVGKFGFGSLQQLAMLMLCFYITGLLFIFIVLNLFLRYYGFSLWKLLGYIKAELLIVFGASSSEAALSAIMEKLENAGCERSIVRLVIPTGYSFNLDGTSIYLSMSVIFLAQVFGIPLSLGQQLTIIGILLVTSKGAAGVSGSGFLVLTSTLTALKVVPVEGLALLIGVDRFMSEGRAIINIIGNTVATVIISKSEKAIDMVRFKNAMNGNVESSIKAVP